LEGEESDEDTRIKDLDDQLFRLIDSTPRPWTVSIVLRIAVVNYPQGAALVSEVKNLDTNAVNEAYGSKYNNEEH